MNEAYPVTEQEREKIIDRFGQEFYFKVLKKLALYSEQWQLSSYRLIPSYSANLVFTCVSARYGDSVLKIASPYSDLSDEYRALLEYDGTAFCRVFAADLENGVMLEERIQPGTPLRDETSLERRLSIFSSLYRDLHKPSEHPEKYPTYQGWVRKITKYMSTRQDCQELYRHMKKADELCSSIAEQYTGKMLLHGDFHHDNILLSQTGGYKIIDPKGVIGDPVWDVPRFILNEFEDQITSELYEKMNKVIEMLAKELKIPENIVRQCQYVETAMGNCWCVEDGEAPEGLDKLLENVEFAERLMKAT